ncbi:MAG: hypothetical protein QM723_15490 [Myxococcaceae bacterium]
MKKFPGELEELLSPKGRRVLAGKERSLTEALNEDRSLVTGGLLHPKRSREVHALLQKTFADVVAPVSAPVPPALTATTQGGNERLPMVARAAMVELSAVAERARSCGLTALLESKSCLAFCERLAGETLRPDPFDELWLQRPFDYRGPRSGHRRGEMRINYRAFELELNFDAPGIGRQLMVHTVRGHLDKVEAVAPSGAVIARVLPIWHYTTPMETKSPKASRWTLRRTFRPSPEEGSREIVSA